MLHEETRQVWKTWPSGQAVHLAWLVILVTGAMLVVEWTLWGGRLRHSRVSSRPPSHWTYFPLCDDLHFPLA